MKKIILTGGGPAGHVTPNLALLPYLEPRFEIHYIGSVGGMEKRLLEPYKGVIYHEIPCVKLVRSLTPKNLLIPFRLLKSVNAAKRLIAEIQPSVIFSKGVPVILHESDLTLGLANRLAARKCAELLTSFDTGITRAKCVGAPLRREIYRGDKSRARLECGFSGLKPVLLVTGGSLGAKALNEAVAAALPALTEKFDVVHLTGRGNLSGVKTAGYYRKHARFFRARGRGYFARRGEHAVRTRGARASVADRAAPQGQFARRSDRQRAVLRVARRSARAFTGKPLA